MRNRDEVIKEFEDIYLGYIPTNEDEEYRDALYKDVLRLLKEQEAIEPEIEGGGSTWWYVCGECHGPIDKADKFCRHCGREVRQDA